MDKITLHGPGDLAAAVPYQLGYFPHDSLVVVALRDRRRIDFTQRIDLPGPEHVDEAVGILLGPALREGIDAVLIAAFEQEAGASLPMVRALKQACGEHWIHVREAVRVHDGRWWGIDCGEGCCPPDGTPVPEAIAAEFVAVGMAPLESRDRLADLVAPDDSADEVLSVLRERGPSSRWPGEAFGLLPPEEVAIDGAGARDLWASILTGARAVEDLEPAEVADLTVSLRDKMWRDGLIAVIVPGSLPMEAIHPEVRERVATLPTPPRGDADASREARRALGDRLLALCRRVPDGHAADLLCVTATLLWWRGDGALARTALDRGLSAAPAHRLSLLTAQLIDHGVRPTHHWPEFADDGLEGDDWLGGEDWLGGDDWLGGEDWQGGQDWQGGVPGLEPGPDESKWPRWPGAGRGVA
ncbi:DUF4192 domain-containing protein [Actinomycetota bacterium]